MKVAAVDQTWHDRFNVLVGRATQALGSPAALVLSVLLVVVWAIVWVFVGFSDSWQLVINTVTTIVTFWMVFVIQSSQNRDTRAIHLKIGEIIRASEDARNRFMAAEKGTEAQIDAEEADLRAESDRSSGMTLTGS